MHEWRSHTAEIELAVDADSPEQVFAEAAEALAELISLGRDGEPRNRQVAIDAADLGALLVEWLGGVVFPPGNRGLRPPRGARPRTRGPARYPAARRRPRAHRA